MLCIFYSYARHGSLSRISETYTYTHPHTHHTCTRSTLNICLFLASIDFCFYFCSSLFKARIANLDGRVWPIALLLSMIPAYFSAKRAPRRQECLSIPCVTSQTSSNVWARTSEQPDSHSNWNVAFKRELLLFSQVAIRLSLHNLRGIKMGNLLLGEQIGKCHALEGQQVGPS